ncbi:hypothetical protein ACP70R_028108 [Stipagrostis hirtigluma subsp. patula]
MAAGGAAEAQGGVELVVLCAPVDPFTANNTSRGRVAQNGSTLLCSLWTAASRRCSSSYCSRSSRSESRVAEAELRWPHNLATLSMKEEVETDVYVRRRPVDQDRTVGIPNRGEGMDSRLYQLYSML